MWDMEWFLKFVVHAVWRRWKGLYYVVSLISIVGNLVVLVGPSLHASIVSRYGALQAVWSALPQVVGVVLHRSVLYVLLNLIVLRIMVKSGVLGRTSTAPIKPDEYCPTASSYFPTSVGVLIKPDEVCTTTSSCHVVLCAPWPACNDYSTGRSTCGTQGMVDAHASPGPSMVLQQAHGDGGSTVTSTNVDAMSMDICITSCVPEQPRKYASCDDEQPKCAPPQSLFTLEPLHDLLQESTEHHSLSEDRSDAHMIKTPEHRLRKVISRADLSMSVDARSESPKESIKAEFSKQRNGQSAQAVVVAAKKHGADRAMSTCEREDDDNELSREAFNELSREAFKEMVDTFISKVKRNLTMQRQDSFNRLLGLVGGGGDMIRLIK